jgi:hypothetical protein
MPPLRVLVVGDVNGEVTKLYKRVASVTKKSGNFDMLLVSGSFFSAEGGADANWGQYLRGELKGLSSALHAEHFSLSNPLAARCVNVFAGVSPSPPARACSSALLSHGILLCGW